MALRAGSRLLSQTLPCARHFVLSYSPGPVLAFGPTRRSPGVAVACTCFRRHRQRRSGERLPPRSLTRPITLDVTLDVTLARHPFVTLVTAAPLRDRRREGDKVEEVEDPPNPSSQGDRRAACPGDRRASVSEAGDTPAIPTPFDKPALNR